MAAQASAAETDWQQRALAAEAEVERLRKRNRELEDELDLLAVANADLRSMAAPAAPAPAPAGPSIESFAALRVHGACRALRTTPDNTFDATGFEGAANATCVALFIEDRGGRSYHSIICGGADGVLYRYPPGYGPPTLFPCGSPPLRLAIAPAGGDILACGCMDGTVRLLTPQLGLWVTFRDHKARCVALAWGGDFLATCARDKTVVVYHVRDERVLDAIGLKDGEIFPEKRHTIVLPSNPESLCFAPGGEELIVYCRGEPFRRHINIETLAETRVSLNEKEWDTHCSFCVLDMAVSPDGKYLACATDANKHVIYELHGNEHVRVLVGHSADEYANARIAWLSDASVVSNSQKDPGLYQWDIGSGKILTHIERAHTKAVRDLAIADDGAERRLATCSFDKKAKQWGLLPS